MACFQHSSARKGKSHVTDAPYSRPQDWWKNPDCHLAQEGSPSRYIDKRPRYKMPRKKIWSIVLLASSLQGSKAGGRSHPAKLEEEFKSLVQQWKEDTFSVSSLTKIYAHPAYQRIMAMGTEGIPFVLKQLKAGEGHWFYALKFMAGKNISAGINNFLDARAAWLEWGYKNNYM
jgi:hypothetical protein